MLNTRIIPMLLAVVFIVGVTVGCSSEKKQSNENLRQAVDEAQRLCQRAIALMADPYYVDKTTGQMAPLPNRLPGAERAEEAFVKAAGLENEASRLKVGGMADVNPRAIQDLEKARGELAAAIGADSLADDTEKGLAKRALADILKIEAQYYWGESISENRKIAPLMDVVNDRADVAVMQAHAIGIMDKVATIGVTEIEKLLSPATESLGNLTTKSEAGQAEMKSLQKEIDDLTPALTERQKKAAEMELNLSGVVGEEALKVFDELAAVRQEIYEKTAKIQDKEFQLQALQADQKILDVEVASKQGEVAALKQSMDAREGLLSSTAKGKTQAQATLKNARDALLQNLNDAQKAYAAWRENGTKASSLLGQAIMQMNQLNASRDAHALADLGGMNMDLGNINAELQFGAMRMNIQQQLLAQVWSDIGGGAELPVPVSIDAEQARKAAVAAFREAARVYREAATALSGNPRAEYVRWVYQASEAKAWRALVEVSTDDRAEATVEAVKVETAAKAGREGSPYLKNVDTPMPSK